MRSDADGRSGASPTGTQTIDRAMLLLREVASYAPLGVKLLDLSEAVHLTKPTTHRILKSLQKSGLVDQESGTRKYKLGSLAMAIEAGAPPSLFIAIARPLLAGITQSTGQTSMLVSRQGRFGYAALHFRGRDTELNRIPGQSRVGYVYLLGPSAASIAILSSLSEAQVEEILYTNEWEVFVRGGVDQNMLISEISRARELGYARSKGQFVQGIAGLAVPISARQNQCFGAITLHGRVEAMTPEYCERLVAPLQQCASEIVTKLLATETA